jgi:hypothetical protein
MKTPMSEKSPGMVAAIEALFPGTLDAIALNQCPVCNTQITQFRDKLSEREYEISGMCQRCQDAVFGK